MHKTTLKKNILANYLSQLYVTGIGILILPFYIKYMGAEAYGLIGFFAMLQAWFALFDIGLTPTIARETARFHGGSMSALSYRQLFRSLTIIFVVVALIGGAGMWYSADTIANKWLNASDLGADELVFSVQIMAISVALRWLGGLYRGVITGAERLVWLSSFNVIIASFKFLLVFPSMWLFGFTPHVFFFHQIVVVIIEISVLLIMANRLKPIIDIQKFHIGWSFKPVQSVMKFALAIAFTSAVWILVTQTDKLILSGILSLSEYGYFTLAVLLASGITVISGPVSGAIMPRMARLCAEGKHDEMILIYKNSTQLVSVVAGAASVVIAFYAETLVYTWTGDKNVATNVAPILRLYALGNGILAISAFPYYLQYALGNLRYHLIGNIITVILLIPALVFSVNHYGGVGAGYVWLGVNSFYLILGVSYIHGRLVPGLHFKWILIDCASIYVPVVVSLSVISYLFSFQSVDRLENLFYLFFVSLIAIVVSMLSSSVIREFIMFKIKSFNAK